MDAENVRMFNLSIAKNETLGYFNVVFSRKKELLNRLISHLE